MKRIATHENHILTESTYSSNIYLIFSEIESNLFNSSPQLDIEGFFRDEARKESTENLLVIQNNYD